MQSFTPSQVTWNQGSCDGFLGRHILFPETCPQSVFAHHTTGVLRPLRQLLELTKRLYEGLTPSVPGLFPRGGEPAIPWVITLFVIHSLYGQPFMVPVADCPIMETPEVVEPLRANGNPPATVPVVVLAFLVKATPYHAGPDSIERAVRLPLLFPLSPSPMFVVAGERTEQTISDLGRESVFNLFPTQFARRKTHRGEEYTPKMYTLIN